MTRITLSAKDGDRVEKLAMEARITRGTDLLEAEIVLRRLVEGRAAECTKYENLYNRLSIEVK